MHPGKLAPCSNGEFVPGPPAPLVREAALVALGWTVLRFTWVDVTERLTSVVSQI